MYVKDVKDFNVICNVNTVDIGQKETRLVSMKFKSQLTCENQKQAPKVSKYVIQGRCWQDQRVN